jgi:hypothetical protein
MPAYPYAIDNGAGERLTFLGVVRTPDGDRAEAEGIAQPGAGPPILITRYRSEYAMLAIPAPVQRLLFPLVLFFGRLLGRYDKYKNAPEPIVSR